MKTNTVEEVEYLGTGRYLSDLPGVRVEQTALSFIFLVLQGLKVEPSPSFLRHNR